MTRQPDCRPFARSRLEQTLRNATGLRAVRVLSTAERDRCGLGIGGIDTVTLDSSVAYIGGWLERLRGDKQFVVEAAARARKSVDLILGLTFEAG